MADETKVFKWRPGRSGARDILPSEVPTQSLFAAAQRGISHLGGNEVAAQMSAYKQTEEGKVATEQELEAKELEFANAKLDKLLNGTLGVRTSSGPRVTGVEALMRSIAVEFLKARFAAYSAKTGEKVSVPTGDKTITVGTQVYNRDQLIDAELRRNEAKIKAEVARRQAQVAEVEGDLV
jgi:hypothetical protein